MVLKDGAAAWEWGQGTVAWRRIRKGHTQRRIDIWWWSILRTRWWPMRLGQGQGERIGMRYGVDGWLNLVIGDFNPWWLSWSDCHGDLTWMRLWSDLWNGGRMGMGDCHGRWWMWDGWMKGVSDIDDWHDWCLMVDLGWLTLDGWYGLAWKEAEGGLRGNRYEPIPNSIDSSMGSKGQEIERIGRI